MGFGMLTLWLEEIRELCSQITKEQDTAKLEPMFTRLRKLLAEVQATTSNTSDR